MTPGKVGAGGGGTLATLEKTALGGATLVTLGKMGAGSGEWAIFETLGKNRRGSQGSTRRILYVWSIYVARWRSIASMVADVMVSIKGPKEGGTWALGAESQGVYVGAVGLRGGGCVESEVERRVTRLGTPRPL